MINQFWIYRLLKNKYFLLFIFWLILTVINVNKAFHIDDAFHLQVSENLRENPTKPMTGLVVWGNNQSPAYEHNQPALFFYLIALFSSIFGLSEISLHLFLSLFTFLSLYYFQQITYFLSLPHKNTLLTLFSFSPALIINQNLMVDVPILALLMAMTYYVVKANHSGKYLHYILAAALLGVGLMIKYSILPLIVVLIIVIVLKREYKKLFVLLVPLTMLFSWSLWNSIEYGSIHILDRRAGGIHINSLWAFFACAGSISVFSISFISGVFRHKAVSLILLIVSILFLLSVVIFYFDQIPGSLYSASLNILFIVNGIIILIALFISFKDQVNKGLSNFIESDSFIFFLFLSSLSLFIILYAPFMATRHILMVTPFVLLFSYDLIDKASKGINKMVFTFTIVLGLVLGISDWKYADYYRQMASSIELPKDSTVWAAGLWGWQWYAKKNGMKQYTTDQSGVHVGDYIVYPGDISPQEINQNLNLVVSDIIVQKANLLSFFSGNNFASMYNSSLDRPPWTLSKNPIDTVYIFEVKSILNDSTFNK